MINALPATGPGADCPPTAFCPDHPEVVTAAGLAAGLFAAAALALAAALVIHGTFGALTRARARLRSRARNAGTRARETAPTHQYTRPQPTGRKERS